MAVDATIERDLVLTVEHGGRDQMIAQLRNQVNELKTVMLCAAAGSSRHASCTRKEQLQDDATFGWVHVHACEFNFVNLVKEGGFERYMSLR